MPNAALPGWAVILAGGQSRRMGRDKASLSIGNERLIDRVIARAAPQADALLLSAPQNYGTGLPFIADAQDAPPGPAGGLWSAARWLAEHDPAADCFLALPVDAPFLPLDLGVRLSAAGAPAIAAEASGLQPTFARWPIRGVVEALTAERCAERPDWSLHGLAKRLGAAVVRFDDPNAFANINRPEDRAWAEAALEREPAPAPPSTTQ